MSFLNVLFLLLVIGSAQSQLKLLNEVAIMEVGQTEIFQLYVGGVSNDGHKKMIELASENCNLLEVSPSTLIVEINSTDSIHNITITSLKAGKSGVFVTSTLLLSENKTYSETSHLVVEMYTSGFLKQLSLVMGWSYFLAWSVSYYPQIYQNFKRKCCQSLSYDLNWYNLFGYGVYNIFNIGMYYSTIVQDQFAAKNPNSINPVHFNDVVYSTHSFVTTLIIIAQCCYYETSQHLSKIANGVLVVYSLVTYIFLLIGFGEGMPWLNILYICSYLKISVCFTRSFPQIMLDYKYKNSRGYSLGTILLDLVGGFMCVAQMVLDSINYDDWNFVIGNPSKLGIAVASIVFDTIFTMQHFFIWNNGLKLRRKIAGVTFQSYLYRKDSFVCDETNSLPLTEQDSNVSGSYHNTR